MTTVPPRRPSKRPVIDRAYSLEEIAGAHRRLESHEQFGKVLVVP